MQLKDTKKGDLVKLLKGSKAVYVRGDYVRGLRKYSLARYDDINAERFVKGSTEVTTDFEF
jgi:hypothetical protein